MIAHGWDAVGLSASELREKRALYSAIVEIDAGINHPAHRFQADMLTRRIALIDSRLAEMGGAS